MAIDRNLVERTAENSQADVAAPRPRSAWGVVALAIVLVLFVCFALAAIGFLGIKFPFTPEWKSGLM